MDNLNQHNRAVLVADSISKRYVQGDLSVDVLNALSLTINKGDRIAIVGSSGSGKSTLLHLLGGLDKPRVSVPSPVAGIHRTGKCIHAFNDPKGVGCTGQ